MFYDISNESFPLLPFLYTKPLNDPELELTYTFPVQDSDLINAYFLLYYGKSMECYLLLYECAVCLVCRVMVESVISNFLIFWKGVSGCLGVFGCLGVLGKYFLGIFIVRFHPFEVFLFEILQCNLSKVTRSHKFISVWAGRFLICFVGKFCWFCTA